MVRFVLCCWLFLVSAAPALADDLTINAVKLTTFPAAKMLTLAPLLRAAMDNAQITAELYTGPWTDVGTPERLAQLNTP